MDMSATQAPADRAMERTLGFEFRGNAREYFGIWIVNLLLSIVTLGIYTAWAKVRRLRYFYGNTFLDGHNFEYHARPMQILIGRIVVVGVLVVVNILITLHPGFLVLLVPYLIAFPWLINKAIAFNARMTTWRNIRLSFEGNYWSALGVFIGMPILASITLGILSPVASRMAANYIGNNTKLGTARFRTDANIGDLYANWFSSIGFAIAAAIALAIAGGVFGGGIATVGVLFDDLSIQELMMGGGVVGAMVGAYGAVFLSLIFYAAGTRNIAFNGTALEGGHRLVSNVSRVRYTWILFSNLIVTILTFTLMRPWAAIRTWRYLMAGSAIVTAGSLDQFVDEQAGKGAVTAAEFFDIEGIDFGL